MADITDLNYYLYKEEAARVAAIGVTAHSFSGNSGMVAEPKDGVYLDLSLVCWRRRCVSGSVHFGLDEPFRSTRAEMFRVLEDSYDHVPLFFSHASRHSC